MVMEKVLTLSFFIVNELIHHFIFWKMYLMRAEYTRADQYVLSLDPFKSQNDINNHSSTKLNISGVHMSGFINLSLKLMKLEKIVQSNLRLLEKVNEISSSQYGKSRPVNTQNVQTWLNPYSCI